MNAAEGHPDRARRHDVARGARRPADGQGLRRRLRGDLTSTTRARTMTVQGEDVQGRRLALHRRHDRRGAGGQARHDAVRGAAGRSSRSRSTRRRAASTAVYAKLMAWADAARRLKVRTNADQPDQAANAVAFGAEGIGLCRTEHMFFGEGRIVADARDDPGRHRGRARRRRSPSSCRCSARTSTASSGRWPAGR